MSRTSEGSAEAALRAQGVTGEHLVSLAHKVAGDELRRRGAYLAGGKYEDLVSHLLVVGCRTAVNYDSTRSGASYSFMSFMYDVMKVRVSDFYRSKGEGFADYRYAPDGAPIQLVGDRIGALAAAGDDVNGSLDPEDDLDLRAASAALADELSTEARTTLELIAYSPRTREDLHSRLDRHVVPNLRRLRVCDVDAVAIRRFARALPPIRAKTHRNIVSVCSAMFSWAVGEGLAIENPVARARERFRAIFAAPTPSASNLARCPTKNWQRRSRRSARPTDR